MIIIRPIRLKDQHLFSEFSIGSLVGMTNLPQEKDKFIKKIAYSEKSFSDPIQTPGEEEYYFVLEDLTTGGLRGICGILAQSRQNIDYLYQIDSLKPKSIHFPLRDNKVLKVAANPSDSSEVCALYLHKAFRHTGQAKLLSFSRFMFIAAFKERFRKNIVAEMRGYFDEQNRSPFWEAIGHHFCTLTINEVLSNIPSIFPFSQKRHKR
jgi:arginine N-succinyltransferase